MSWWLRPDNAAVRPDAPAIAPSMLAADFSDLRGQIEGLESDGADLLHLDVMDGHFVPNLTFGPFIVKAIRRCTDLFLDAHLMISRPDQYLDVFAEAGADAITIHIEAEADVDSTLARIGELGLKRGISLNPDTDLSGIDFFLPDVDLVLVMGVQPGFGGQKFNPVALEKIDTLAKARVANGYEYAISVDGGVDATTAPACRDAGADILVSGTYFVRADDREAAALALRG